MEKTIYFFIPLLKPEITSGTDLAYAVPRKKQLRLGSFFVYSKFNQTFD
ncbi:hypothetical protein KIS4809_0650 [Bacillus sp. ZZV12-4809]|nr:hypothetical protein KIS4809_0650 [Bacillus sp. ZZV12-4809]